ncbi:GNAT family N-acetyltransferase [Flavimarina sp. Hel_I_48]|uniref:GNAT family N-acetyltransferase n=1 Tax=Flavimarina sp. Hel_I_48 TaxID=1392488 RepID=UPI0004DF445E|nr:GNAT family N-acetyltransferase [Flavimarina sp. Hel_I_48]
MFDFVGFNVKSTDWFQNQAKQHLYLSKSWLDTLVSTYKFEIIIAVDKHDRYVTAFCKRNDMMGKRLISLPFSDYIPFTEEDSSFYENLFASCAARFPEYEIILRTNRAVKLLEKPYKLSKEAVFHTIDLTSDKLPKQSSSFTRGVTQAQKNGVSIQRSTSLEAVERFYKLYHRLRFDKFNIIPQPFSFFENLWKTMINRDFGAIFEAVYEENVIASMFILEHNEIAYYKYGCSAIDFLQLKPNNLLFHELITHFRERNYKAIDLGLSGSGESYAGLRRWKSSMGGDEHPISYWSYASAENKRDNKLISENKKVLKNLTDAMVKADLDAEQTSLLSDQLYALLA